MCLLCVKGKMWVRWPTVYFWHRSLPLTCVFTFRRQQGFHFTKHCTYVGASWIQSRRYFPLGWKRMVFTHIRTKYGRWMTITVLFLIRNDILTSLCSFSNQVNLVNREQPYATQNTPAQLDDSAIGVKWCVKKHFIKV